jgi:hypothetical protein
MTDKFIGRVELWTRRVIAVEVLAGTILLPICLVSGITVILVTDTLRASPEVWGVMLTLAGGGLAGLFGLRRRAP